MENNKQTAVEWLINQIEKDSNIRLRGFDIDGVGKQAKEMEKQQIMELKFQTLIAYGVPLEKAIMFSEQYYNKEYGNET